MPRFGCVTRMACRVTGQAHSRRRAKTKASRSGRFRKNKRRKIDGHVAGCGVAACAARYGRRRRRCADCSPSGHSYARATRIARRFCRAARAVCEKGACARRKPRGANFPAIPEAAESAFRFRLARIEDTARRDVGCIAIRTTSEQPDRAELQQAVQRLTRTVDHLLDATRLESGLLQPLREWCDPAELVREAVASSGLKDSAVRINIAE